MKTMQRLHEYGQELAMEENGWSIDDFRRIFGRNYLPEDWEPRAEEEGFFILENDEAC
jgi:hypothetical protein